MFESLLSWWRGEPRAPDPPQEERELAVAREPAEGSVVINGVALSPAVAAQIRQLGLPLASLPPYILAKAERAAAVDCAVLHDPHGDPMELDEAIDYDEGDREFDAEEDEINPAYKITGIRVIGEVAVHPGAMEWSQLARLRGLSLEPYAAHPG